MKAHLGLAIAILALGACGGTNSGDDTPGPDAAAAIDAAPPDSSLPCGGCADGDTCGSANGHEVCIGPTGVPRLDHVFIIMMENTSYQTLMDSANTPFLHSLVAAGATSTNYHGVEHPSLSNYIALESGSITDNGPLSCDCEPTGDACGALNCNLLSHSCGCPQPQDEMVTQLEAVGVTWRAYAEDMGTPCNLVSAGHYETKHVPFLYFPALTDDTARCTDHVVDYTQLAADLPAARRFTYITPNMIHNMHDPIVPDPNQNLPNGDTWLAQEVPAILASAAFQHNGALFIVWDEDDLSGVINPDDPIPFFMLSPLAETGGVSDLHHDHYDLLATFEDVFGVPRLGAAADATPMTELFHVD